MFHKRQLFHTFISMLRVAGRRLRVARAERARLAGIAQFDAQLALGIVEELDAGGGRPHLAVGPAEGGQVEALGSPGQGEAQDRRGQEDQQDGLHSWVSHVQTRGSN